MAASLGLDPAELVQDQELGGAVGQRVPDPPMGRRQRLGGEGVGDAGGSGPLTPGEGEAGSGVGEVGAQVEEVVSLGGPARSFAGAQGGLGDSGEVARAELEIARTEERLDQLTSERGLAWWRM